MDYETYNRLPHDDLTESEWMFSYENMGDMTRKMYDEQAQNYGSESFEKLALPFKVDKKVAVYIDKDHRLLRGKGYIVARTKVMNVVKYWLEDGRTEFASTHYLELLD